MKNNYRRNIYKYMAKMKTRFLKNEDLKNIYLCLEKNCKIMEKISNTRLTF